MGMFTTSLSTRQASNYYRLIETNRTCEQDALTFMFATSNALRVFVRLETTHALSIMQQTPNAVINFNTSASRREMMHMAKPPDGEPRDTTDIATFPEKAKLWVCLNLCHSGFKIARYFIVLMFFLGLLLEHDNMSLNSQYDKVLISWRISDVLHSYPWGF